LNRLTNYCDSNGNSVLYEYDTKGRVTKLTPAQGTNYRTEYTYNQNGSVSQVRVFDAGSSADTIYTYSTSTGRLTERHFPTVSSQYVKTAYSYDAYGRLEYETVSREGGGTTNLYRTQYVYSRIAFGIQLERAEQTYSGGWVNADKTQYQWDTLGRQTYEERFDYVLGNWVNRYDITQTYDKNGNRTGYHKNVVSGYESSYGKHYNLSYTFDNVNALTAISDGDDANYSCSVTSDANLNITQVTESDTRIGGATLYTYFEYDGLNRMTVHKTKRNPFAGVTSWLWTKRTHQYDATGRLVKSNWKSWNDGQQEPGGNTLEHIYAGAKHIQNYDGSSTYGAVWHWAGAQHEHMGPLNNPNPDTASQKAYNLAAGGADESGGGGAGGMSPQRRTFTAPTTEGDQRNLFGQGRPMAKDSSGGGSAWATGTTSQYTGKTGYNVESRLMFEGTVAQTDMSRATDAREKQRIGIFGTGLSYAGSYGRVTSESIGRDLNPLGRGAGQALVAGALVLGTISARFPAVSFASGVGNSVNNGCDCSNCGVWTDVDGSISRADTSMCQTPGCEGEFCNRGCAIGWVSGTVATCCKDIRRPCNGPISVTVGIGQMQFANSASGGCSDCGGGSGSSGDDRTSDNLHYWQNELHSEADCLGKGYCWNCCNGCSGNGESTGTSSSAPSSNATSSAFSSFVKTNFQILARPGKTVSYLLRDNDQLGGALGSLFVFRRIWNDRIEQGSALAAGSISNCCCLRAMYKTKIQGTLKDPVGPMATWNPCTTSGLESCMDKRQPHFILDQFYTEGYGYTWINYEKHPKAPCIINIAVTQIHGLYDLARTIAHEWSHCCGTREGIWEEDPETKPVPRSSPNIFTDISAWDVEKCVQYAVEAGGGASQPGMPEW
jgi:YD repeat-containing protein